MKDKTCEITVLETNEAQLLFACAKIGALVTLLNYAYTPREIVTALKSTSKYSFNKTL